MSEQEQTYDDDRAKNLERMLVALAERIRSLAQEEALLRHAGELTKLIGEVRSELFHYEVRATFDSPDVAENRRIVADAERGEKSDGWKQTEWTPDDDEEEPTW